MKAFAAKRWLAIALGVIGPLVVAVALDSYVAWDAERSATQFLQTKADELFGRIERRISSIEQALVDLGNSGSRDCSALDINAMRQAVYRTSQIKEIAVLDRSNIVLCTHLGVGGQHRLLSSEVGARRPNLALAMIQTADREGRMLRVRWNSNDGMSVAALVPIDQLQAENTLLMGKALVHLHLALADGTPIIDPSIGELDDAHAGRQLRTERASERYPVRLAMDVPLAGVLADRSDVTLASWLAVTCALIALLLVSWYSRRQGPDVVAQLSDAIRRGEFIPYYQPIIDITTGQLRGCEVLVRRRLPDGSLQAPAAFINLIEKNGLAIPMTRHLMKGVRDEIGPYYALRPRLKISFNLVAEHFNDNTIIEDVERLFEGSLLRFNQIVFEVTERDPLIDLDGARRVIAGLQARGVRIALDDVGAGHAGLSYILKLGVDSLKIDKLFIDAIEVERTTSTIIETIVGLAATMHMDVVAEGVESFEQVQYLREKGVTAAQGYVFSPPLPGSSFITLMEAMEPVSALVAVSDKSEPARRPATRSFG